MPNPVSAGVQTAIKVHDEQVQRGLREIKRTLDADVKGVLLDAANAVSLPAVRLVGVPHRDRAMFIAKSSRNKAIITTRGSRKESRVIGLLEYGGTVKTEILPKKRQALMLGPGQFVSRVSTPRKYRGKHLMEGAVRASMPRYSAHVEKNLARIMHSRIAHASTFG